MSNSWKVNHPFGDDVEERRVLFAALDSFRQYRRAAHFNTTHRRRQNLYALPTAQWQILSGPPFNILSSLDRVDDAIDANAEIASKILESGLDAFGLETEPTDLANDWKGTAKAADLDKARSTLRQFYRDWSAEGVIERRTCFAPVIDDLYRLFGGISDKAAVRVLVPGAGLGRLVFEVCKLGYTVEGNELSYHQLMSSNWILNQTARGEQLDLYPFALTFSNNSNRENQLKCVKIPDVHPGTDLDSASMGMATHAFERMSMTAADFLILYGDISHRGTFDAVLTVFFLDTAPNVLRYIEVVHNCLKEGGYWMNLGPLLWHFEERGPSETVGHGDDGTARRGLQDGDRDLGIAEPGSVELTDEEVLLLVARMGFVVERHEIRTEKSGYIQDPESMLQNAYRVSHWVARKCS